jgi:hypothetical protein
MLFRTLNTNGIFKRGHLAALSGLNVNTLATYLHFLHKISLRKTEERKASRFTGIEAIAVVLMAELQREWDVRPEKSFATAYWAAGHFVDQFDKNLKGKGNPAFPKSTFTAAFDPDEMTGIVSQSGDAFMEAFAELMPSYRMAAVIFADQRTHDIAFAPVLDLYEVLTGIDLIDINTKESRRDDAPHG